MTPILMLLWIPITAAPTLAWSTPGLVPLQASTLLAVPFENAEDDTCLLLRNGRFRVTVLASSQPNKRMTPVRGVSLRHETGTDETGYFYFEDPENIDLTVRVFDGCSFNNHFWVFTASLTKVAYEITVTDTLTNLSKIYSNPLGQQSPPIQDTEAFATCPVPPPAAAGEKVTAPARLKAGDTMRLHNGRFEVQVDYEIPGEMGPGTVGIETQTSGAFWLRDRSDFNIYLQIIDGRAINGHYWFAWTSLTGANYHLRVLDTLTNRTRVFANPLNTSTFGTDTLFTDRGTQQLVFPWISNSDQFDSTLIVNNNNCIDASVTLEARRASGEPEIAKRLIPASGFFRESAASLFPEFFGSGYSVLLTSDIPGIHGSWFSNNLHTISGASPAQGVAIQVPSEITSPLPENARVARGLLFGYLPVENNFFSAPVITNVGDEPTDISLYFYDQQGNLALSQPQAIQGLEPFRPFATVTSELFFSGNFSMVAHSEDQPLTGVIFLFNSDGEPAISNATGIDFIPPN